MELPWGHCCNELVCGYINLCNVVARSDISTVMWKILSSIPEDFCLSSASVRKYQWWAESRPYKVQTDMFRVYCSYFGVLWLYIRMAINIFYVPILVWSSEIQETFEDVLKRKKLDFISAVWYLCYCHLATYHAQLEKNKQFKNFYISFLPPLST